jgi:hypothetical protein
MFHILTKGAEVGDMGRGEGEGRGQAGAGKGRGRGRDRGGEERRGSERGRVYIFSSLDPFTTGLAFANATLFIDL